MPPNAREVFFMHQRSTRIGGRLIAKLAVLLVLGLIALTQSYAQTTDSKPKPNVVLTILSAPSDNTVAQELARTLTGSIDLMLQLTGTLDVHRADFLVPTYSLARTIGYYRQTGADEAIYGSVAAAKDGSYLIDVDIWNASKPGEKPKHIHKTITNLLASFDLSDQLALEAASAAVGHTLTEGTLLVTNLGELKQYAVYANGHLLGRDKASYRLLTGPQEIVVAKPGDNGDVPVEFFHTTITEGQTTKLALSVQKPKAAAPAAASAKPSTTKAETKQAAPPSTAKSGLALGPDNFNLAYNPSSGIFGHPSLRFGSRSYPLAGPDEFAWAIALMSSLPGIPFDVTVQLKSAKQLLAKKNRRSTSFITLSALALGGLGAATYGLLSSNQTALTVGGALGLASLTAAVPTRMLQSDSQGQINTHLEAAIRAYRALPLSKRQPNQAQTYFASRTDFGFFQQGKNNWFYGYRAGNNGRFQLMQDFHADKNGSLLWWADYARSNTAIGDSGMGSDWNGKNGHKTGPQNVDLRFVVPADGTYQVQMSINRTFDHGTNALFSCLRNDKELWSQSMPAGDIDKHSKNITEAFKRGDTIDFLLADTNDKGWDWTNTRITIERKQ